MIHSKIRHLPILVTLYTWAATVGREVVLGKKNSPSVLNKTGGKNHRHIITAYPHAKNNTNTLIFITLCTGRGLQCLAIRNKDIAVQICEHKGKINRRNQLTLQDTLSCQKWPPMWSACVKKAQPGKVFCIYSGHRN